MRKRKSGRLSDLGTPTKTHFPFGSELAQEIREGGEARGGPPAPVFGTPVFFSTTRRETVHFLDTFPVPVYLCIVRVLGVGCPTKPGGGVGFLRHLQRYHKAHFREGTGRRTDLQRKRSNKRKK